MAHTVSSMLAQPGRSPAALCPGWRVWHDTHLGQWTAQRLTWHHSHRDGDRVFVLWHEDPGQLVRLVAWQAELDLARLHPEWACGQLPSGRWAAQWQGTGRVVTAPGAAHLAAELGRLAGRQP